jgi:hypothetical protein
MSNKNNKKAPVMMKQDTTENWKKAVNYIPPFGTIIVYTNPDGSIVEQLKFGNGKELVNNLPNLLNSRPAKINEEDEELLEL